MVVDFYYLIQMMKIELYTMQLLVNSNAYLYEKYGNKKYGIQPKKIWVLGMGIVALYRFIVYISLLQ